MIEIEMPEKIKIMSTALDGKHCTFIVPRYMASYVIKAIIKDTYDTVDIVMRNQFGEYKAYENNKNVGVRIDVIETQPYSEQKGIADNVLIGMVDKVKVKMIF